MRKFGGFVEGGAMSKEASRERVMVYIVRLGFLIHSHMETLTSVIGFNTDVCRVNAIGVMVVRR